MWYEEIMSFLQVKTKDNAVLCVVCIVVYVSMFIIDIH